MEIYGEISKVRAAVKAWKKDGLTVGFVPTMGVYEIEISARSTGNAFTEEVTLI